jgi:para-aminobenzoate synthetase component I
VIARDADPLDPAEAARRAARGDDAFWVSSPGPEGDVEIAFDAVGTDPVQVVRGGELDTLEEAWRVARERWNAAGEAPAGVPIGVGWLSYDLGRRWIPLPARAADDHGWPELELRFHDAVWVRDAARGSARILACDARAGQRLADRLATPAAGAGVGEGVGPAPSARGPMGGGLSRLGELRADMPAARYFAAVERILAYLVAGDAYQVNLARRLSATLAPGDPVWLPQALRARSPAPHAIWLACNGGRDYLIGNSPERFLRADGRGAIETRPIKGTRPRGATPSADQRLRQELLAAPKERAEHIMIVDLERNDLGKVCLPGSIAVEGLARVLTLPTVFHLATIVRGQLRSQVDFAELLRATFPGGSITGAPKRRAMEIIEELEPVRRGPYTGATGWLGAAGDLDLAVAIRTALVRGQRFTLSVGGGIVADSTAASELAETEAKARAFSVLATGLAPP